MDKLNQYLQALLTSCSDELHLVPNKQPYLVSAKGETELANSPMLGTQISMLIFPLIPSDVKQQLPSQPEVEFVYRHQIGAFNFVVRKSPSGFKVIVRPLLTDAPNRKAVVNDAAAPIFQQAQFESNAPFLNNSAPSAPTVSSAFGFENASAVDESKFAFSTDELILPPVEAESATKASFAAETPSRIDVVPVNSPEFITSFSDTSNYEPPGRRDDFIATGSEFPPPNDFSGAPNEYSFSSEFNVPMTTSAPSQNPAFAKNYGENHQPETNFPPTNFPAAQNFPPPAPQSLHSETAAFTASRQNPQAKARMNALFQKMADIGASDLHLSVSTPPMIRKDGKMQILPSNETTLTADSIRELLLSIMPAKNQEEFAARNDSDFAYEIPNLARFRANIFMDRKGMGGVFRIIPTKILTAEQLGLSPAIMNLCGLSKGLVVVTGPTGSGKSTTLCAMVDSINKTREDHIITIEDPIEFTHENQKCLVNQREVHNHTDSFKDALRAALREDPDILLVGEMRDLETISIAIETAETGHLVFGTLHTTTAASTVDRIIDQFPADRQQQIRVMLSESLKGVIAQTLVPKKGGGRVAALEVLIVTPAISNLIREGKTFQIPSAMQTGKQHGMVILNDALFALVQKNLVEPRNAYLKAVDKANFETLLTRGGFKI